MRRIKHKKREPEKSYGLTLETAQRHLDAWLEAELEVTTHQSYQIGTKNLTMADLGEIRETIDYWSQKVEQLKVQQESGGRNRIIRVIPRDY